MPKYSCEVPIAGVSYIEVEASSEEEAIAKALDATNNQLSEVDFTPVEVLGELNAVSLVAKGNVFYGPCAEANADELPDG